MDVLPNIDQQLSVRERNKMAAIWGLVVGIVYIILTTMTYMLSSNVLLMGGVGILCFLVVIALAGVFAGRIRKANGGYFDFKEAFSVIFIILLVATSINFFYSIAYTTVIDPGFAQRMKTHTIEFMTKMKVPDDQIDQKAKELDETIEKSKHFNLSNNVLNFLGSLLVHCLFGLLAALAVKKQKPIFD